MPYETYLQIFRADDSIFNFTNGNRTLECFNVLNIKSTELTLSQSEKSAFSF